MKVIDRTDLNQGEEVGLGVPSIVPHFFQPPSWKTIAGIPEVRAWLQSQASFHERGLRVLLSKSEAYQTMIADIVKMATPPGRTLLSLGEGFGEVSSPLATGSGKKPSKVYFMSADWRSCASARDKLDGARFRQWMGLIVAAPLTNIPVPRNSVDTVIENFATSWFPVWFDEDGTRYEGGEAVRLLLLDVRRVLKPGGRLVFAALRPEASLWPFWKDLARSVIRRFQPIDLPAANSMSRPPRPMLYRTLRQMLKEPMYPRFTLDEWQDCLTGAGFIVKETRGCLARQGFLIHAIRTR